jgi:hypothetical protein
MHAGEIDPKLCLFRNEAGFHLRGYVKFQNVWYLSE